MPQHSIDFHSSPPPSSPFEMRLTFVRIPAIFSGHLLLLPIAACFLTLAEARAGCIILTNTENCYETIA